MALYISIPGYWNEYTSKLHIPSLKIEIEVNSKEEAQEALLKCVQNDLKLDIYDLEVVWAQPFAKRAYSADYEALEVLSRDWDRLVSYALELEPLVDTPSKRRAKKDNHLINVNAEDVLNYGYDYDWLDKK